MRFDELFIDGGGVRRPVGRGALTLKISKQTHCVYYFKISH